jgi:hypothetical protein
MSVKWSQNGARIHRQPNKEASICQCHSQSEICIACMSEHENLRPFCDLSLNSQLNMMALSVRHPLCHVAWILSKWIVFCLVFHQWLMCCLKCCAWCFEKIVMFINRNAFIIVGIKGSNYCSAACTALKLILTVSRAYSRWHAILFCLFLIYFAGKAVL